MASPLETRYRVTILPDGETPLFGSLDGNGDVVEADFGTPGWSHDRPYLKVPQNALVTETQFVEGNSKIGGFTMELLDKRQDADDQTSGLVSSIIDQVPASEVIFERYFDSLSAWRVVFRGRADRVTIGDTLLTYRIDLLDGRGYESDDLLFSTNETFVLYPEAGPTEDYGEIPDAPGEYLLPASRDAFLTVVIPSFLGVLPNPFFGRTYFYFKLDDTGFENTADARRAAERVQKYGTFGGAGTEGASTADQITIRYRSIVGGDYTYLRQIALPGTGANNAIFSSWAGGFVSSPVGVGGRSPSQSFLAGGSFDASGPAPFDDGDTLRVQVLARKTTNDTPYIWDGGTVGDLLHEITQGEHTDEVPREKYDATALAAFRTATPQARFIETSPQNRKAWVAENIYKPTLHAPALNRNGEIAPVYWPITEEALDAAETLQFESITPIGTWEHEVARLYNRVEGAYISETLEEEEEDEGEDPEKLSPYERLVETDVPLTIDRSFFFNPLNIEVADLPSQSIDLVGPRPLSFNPKTLRVFGDVPGYGASGPWGGPGVPTQVASDLFEQITARFGLRGAPTFEAECRMSDTVVRDAQVGDWLRVEATWTPDYATKKRSAVRYMQVYGITDPNPAKRILFLLDSGVAAPSGDNTFDPENPNSDCLDNATSDPTFESVGDQARKLLVYKGNGDFTLQNDCGEAIEVDLLLIAGGGGGGGGATGGTTAACGGGGAAGGVVGAYGADDVIDSDPDPVTVSINAGETIPITVGAGGAGGTGGGDGTDGGDTIVWADANGNALDPLTDTPVYRAVGGGGGGSATINSEGRNGGSGGGGGGTTNVVNAFTNGGAAFEDQGRNGAAGLASGTGFALRTTIAGSGGAFGGAGTGASTTADGQQQGGDGVTLAKWGLTTGWGGGGGYARVGGVGGDTITEGSALNGNGGVWGAGGGGGAAADGQAGRDGLVLIRYKGAAPALSVPTSTFDTSDIDARILEVNVAEADFLAPAPAGYRIRVEYAVSDTEPASSSGLWTFAGYLYEAGDVTLPQLPSGTTVWKRTRAEATGIPPSPWETAASTTITSVPSLLFAQLTRDRSAATFTFTPNAACGGLRVLADKYAIDATGDKDATTERAELDATTASPYSVTLPLERGQEIALAAVCFAAFAEFDPDAGLTVADDFDRADSGTVGNGWTESGVGSTEIASNRAVLEASSTNGVFLERNDVAGDAVLVQATVRGSSNAALPYIYIYDPDTDNGYLAAINTVGVDAQGIYRADGALTTGLTSLADTGDDQTAATDGTVQFYAAAGVQQMFFEEGGSSATASATDADHEGPFEVAFRHGSNSGTTNTQLDDVIVCSGGREITVTGLPTGYDVQILNAGASVVATATESGGTATINAMRSGDASEDIPVAGWPTIRVRNASDTVVYTSEDTAIYPGVSFTWSVDNQTLEGVAGTQGDTVPLAISRPGLPGDPPTDPIDRIILDQDFAIVVDQNGNILYTQE